MAERQARKVPRFGRRFLDGEDSFSQIGEGALGGKASGLATIHYDILERFDATEFPDVRVTVPTLTVLSTDLFEAFLDQNRLWEVGLSDLPDERLAHAFLRASVPAAWVGDLRALLQRVHQPLAVRSSSLLEDALQHPLAGVYATKMIPNQAPLLDRRHALLLEAIKLVWASTFFAGAKAYLGSIGRSVEGERMAVIVQEVMGRRLGTHFYPTISAVARSYNYYPVGAAEPEEGVVSLALGLGKTIVDGGLCWSYSPAFPTAPPPFADVGALMKNTQTRFWAVDMGPPPAPDPVKEAEFLVSLGLDTAESDRVLQHLASTYDAASDRTYPGLAPTGPRVLDFSPLLQLADIPLNSVVRRLVEASEAVVGGPVEIELAVDIDPEGREPTRVGFLQVRPMYVSSETVDVTEDELSDRDVLLASENVMGNGVRRDIEDVIYVKPEAFEPKATRQVAREVAALNDAVQAEGRHFMLVGFGRWGSADPWLGVPVAWAQISAARVIVEAAHEAMSPDMSQGSHFFHNMIGFRVLYLSVPRHAARPVDWDWLERQPVAAETTYVKHVRTLAPLTVRVDGRARRGVVRTDGGNRS